jgi:hypothetical protein
VTKKPPQQNAQSAVLAQRRRPEHWKTCEVQFVPALQQPVPSWQSTGKFPVQTAQSPGQLCAVSEPSQTPSPHRGGSGQSLGQFW